MSQFTIHIPLDDYLADWFIHECGGGTPVTLKKGSIESKILEIYLAKRPDDVKPDLGGAGKVAIFIPSFRHKPAHVYNYLPKHATAALVEAIRNRFDIVLWDSLHHFGKITRNRQDHLIYAFMEKHGIEFSETSWNAIAKRYQRQRKIYYDREFHKKTDISKKYV